jgi:hypothetical protein
VTPLDFLYFCKSTFCLVNGLKCNFNVYFRGINSGDHGTVLVGDSLALRSGNDEVNTGSMLFTQGKGTKISITACVQENTFTFILVILELTVILDFLTDLNTLSVFLRINELAQVSRSVFFTNSMDDCS